MGNLDSKPDQPSNVQHNQQQRFNVPTGQGQNLTRPQAPPQAPSQANLNAQRPQPLQQNQTRPAMAVSGQTITSSQVPSHPLSAQRPQSLQQNQTRPAMAVSGQTMTFSQVPSHQLSAQKAHPLQQNQTRPDVVFQGPKKRRVHSPSSAPPIPPLPTRNLDNLLQEPSTSSTYGKLPEPLVPIKKEKASGIEVINKPQPTKPTTYHEITLNLNTNLPMLKASIRDVKDPKFLHFHKELSKTKPLSDIRLSLINNQHLSDVKLIVGDQKEVVYGHKMFLITSSSLFLTHFEYNKDVELILENIETPILLEVLTYCYTSQVKITEQNVLDLLTAANNLKVRQLSNICHTFISNLFNEDSIFIIFEKALEQKNEIFEKKCIAFMLNNEEKCFSSKGFYKIGFTSLLDIIGRCKFSNDKNEELIKKWNYGEENMAFVAAKENPVKDPVKPETKAQNKPVKAKASTSAQSMTTPKLPSLLDLVLLGESHNTEFVFRDDDNESVVSKDDDREMKTRVFLTGNNNRGTSEFSRLDLCCKKSVLVHEIGFTADLSRCGKDIKVSISLFEGNRRSDIHNRTIVNDRPGMRINYIKFARNPLKFYIGQKFFIKVNFVGPVSLVHVSGDKFSHPDIFEMRKDVEKNYLNCISYIVVSDMPRS